MTAQQIYENAAAYLFESVGDDSKFSAHAPRLISALAAEALPYENAHRAALGQPELDTAPSLEVLGHELPFSDGICHAISMGLVSLFWQDECDDYKAQDWRGRFIDALELAAPALPIEVEDAY